ncbi:hypothetical protein [Streptomyces hainanensis]|uniref:Uncharacterized protein n=1 Tax=Streptomyces hainanensis TaxID=402648 RepID=A0A4R4TQ46_9ACTN|nr:hypothetical protein [Streptomyces hainanensis]TDC77263.1 hypothetical protein E1283_07725 [Streptomyces hainanensis]
MMSQLRMIDSAPRAETGQTTFVRASGWDGMPEIWYRDRYLFTPENANGLMRLDLTYCQYIDTLRATKGTLGWPLLYGDILLRGKVFHEYVLNLRKMLEIFPQEFPGYDYAELNGRLAERL